MELSRARPDVHVHVHVHEYVFAGALVLALALGGCSGGKAKAVEDARSHTGSGSGSGSGSGATGEGHADAQSGQGQGSGDGDVQVRVEWKDVPAIARASSGRTACGTPRAPSVSPSTTWGIPDVFVTIDVDKTVTPKLARIVLDECALAPRIAIAGAALVLASDAEAPVKLGLTKVGQLPLGGAAAAASSKSVYLPVTGHEVEVALDPRGIYLAQIENPDGKGFDPETAWVVSADTPYLAITEGNGQTTFRDIPVGTYAVHAWLPPRAGQDQRIAHGTVTVAAGDLAEVTLNLAP